MEFRGMSLIGISILSCLLMMSACSRCSLPKKDLAVKDIGLVLAPAICDKYASCNQQGQEFNREQCLKDISGGVAENLKQTPDLKVDQAKLNNCIESIKKASCEAMSSATPPEGCEFLQ